MIKIKEGKVEIIGKKEEIGTDLALIFDSLIKIIGEDETKKMIKYSYEALKDLDKELDKEIIKKDLPDDLAKILLELI